MQTISLSFIFFLALITFIGIYAATKAKKSSVDYLLASRDVGPVAMSLSAFSSALSGFMFIGFIGFTYYYGVSAMWYVIGWILGDLMAWLFFYKRLREESEELNTNTISSFIGTYKDKAYSSVIKFGSIISFVFLAVYAAAQLKASGKALHAILGWDYNWGIIVGALIVLAYCLSGGIRASIWTDVAQTIIMIIAMYTLLGIALYECGGINNLFETLRSIDPGLLEAKPSGIKTPILLFTLALLANGIGVVGQPHIVVRAMLIKSVAEISTARNIYIFWYILFATAAVGVGLAARVLLPGLTDIDSELALPTLSMQLLPEILVGLILAGIFSSTISTADSQIISCSASLSQDLITKWKENFLMTKVSTLIALSLVLIIALNSTQSVFDLVVIAWSALACSIGSIVILRCCGKKISEKTSLAMMLVGMLTVIIWKYNLGWSDSLHEALPGFIAAFMVYFLSSKLSKNA